MFSKNRATDRLEEYTVDELARNVMSMSSIVMDLNFLLTQRSEAERDGAQIPWRVLYTSTLMIQLSLCANR